MADDDADAAFNAVFDAARADLYAADYDDFIPTRVRLAAVAKKAGAADVAKRITALRKPTRAAWTLNRLARLAGADLTELFELGDALRGAQTSLDGPALRALSAQRRHVVDALVDQALLNTGQTGAAEGLRAEVRSTLEAALVDLDVRADVSAGVLVRAAQFVGFGDFGGPALSLVPDQSPRTALPNFTPRTDRPNPPPPRTSAPATSAQNDERSGSDAPAKPTRTQAAAQAREARAAEAERRRVEAQQDKERRERQQADARRSAAREAVAAADAALAQAVDTEKQSGRGVRLAQEQLADARRRLDDARLDVRRARSEQSKAVKALRELQ